MVENLSEKIQLLASAEVQQWLSEQQDALKVALKKSPFESLTPSDLAQQVQAKNRASKKLPTWANTAGIVYPVQLSMEQCSSEVTARKKAELMQLSGKRVVDLTAGLGIDTWAFSEFSEQTIYLEKDLELSSLAEWNFSRLGANIQVVQEQAENFISSFTFQNHDVVFLDPARRDDKKGKVYLLEDCTPNIIELLPELLEKVNTIWIKLSPMLSLSEVETKLGTSLSEIHVLSVSNECKELLIKLSAEPNEPVVRFSHAFLNHSWQTTQSTNTVNELSLSDVKGFIYEPDTAILKANQQDVYCSELGLSKLAAKSNVFTSDEKLPQFIGRVLKVEDVYPGSQKKFPFKAASIVRRNYPVSPEELRKKLKLKESKTDFLYATTLADGKKVLIHAKRLN